MKRQTIVAATVFTAGLFSFSVSAQQITVMISGGFSAALDQLAPAYTAKTGDTLRIIHGPSMGNSAQAIPKRLSAGQSADVVVMVGYALDKLIQEGKIAPESRTELADSRVGMVVRVGDKVPDISSVSALKIALLNAKSIAYSDSASGQYVETELFKKLGIEKDVADKAKMIEKIPVASVVAKGDAEFGFQQVSELLPIKGVTFVGRIPESVQYVTRFAGAVVADAQHPAQARQLLQYLSSKEVQNTVRKTGMDSITATGGKSL